MHHLARAIEWSRRFRAHDAGGVAIFFAFALIPIFGAVGAAVDYGRAATVRTRLLAAADAASVGSVSKVSTGMTMAATMSSDGTVPGADADAVKLFMADVAGQTDFTLTKVSATVTKAKGTVTSTVNFAATVPSDFMGIFGIKSIPVAGSSIAANSMPTFIDFYLLLDNTPSMGVGATPADVATMVNNTPDKCAFACHDLSDPKNYYNLAKKLGVTTRIDVVRTATQKLMDTAAATTALSNQFRAAIYTFGTNCTSLGLSTITTLTSSLSSAKTAAANIDLMTIPYQGYNNDQCTDSDGALTAINAVIKSPGDGSSSKKPQKILFFVTDGVADANNPLSCSKPLTGGTRCQEPMDASYCKKIKDRGIKIAVLYTTYLPLPTNAWYNTWIAPFQSQIGSNMQSCASPGLYFEVSPTQGISEAMNALFQKAVATAHLTN